MKKMKIIYQRTSKQTQNKLQELFDTFNFTSENIYNIVDNKNKKRINTYIEQWKEQGLLKNNNYFTSLANNIYRRTRVKNSEILELLIYSAYIEEQKRLEEQEKQIMYEDANYYYQEGIKEVEKKKKPSILTMALFLALLDQPNYSGFNWKQYIEATMQYNAQQIYKQVILNIQQKKDIEINSSEFQTIINRQNNQKLNINGDKISGAVDLQMIGLNNLAKVEGIKEVAEDNSKVRFIAVEDDKTTLMCDSLNNQEFYINKENVFDRYYGETQKELTIQRIRCNGLVLGLNLPPIQHYFHYCRSSVTYLTHKTREEIDKIMHFEYKDITSEVLKRNKRHYGIIEQQYFVDNKGNKYIVDGKNVIMKHTAKEREVAPILGEIYGGKVRLIPAVLNPQHIKTPDYMIKDKKIDLKEPTGKSRTTIYDLFKHKSEQADNFVIDIHKSGLDRTESIEQAQQLFYSKHRSWINTVILMENNEIFKILKRR